MSLVSIIVAYSSPVQHQGPFSLNAVQLNRLWLYGTAERKELGDNIALSMCYMPGLISFHNNFNGQTSCWCYCTDSGFGACTELVRTSN